MTTADWIQCGIAAIYAAILVVMLVQLRDQRRASAQQSDAARDALAAALAAVREAGRLAELHAKVADHAERSARAAEAASAAATEANALAVASEQRAAARREEDRRTAAIALAHGLRQQRDALVRAHAVHYMGHESLSAHIVLSAARQALAAVSSEVQELLGPTLAARLLATRDELDRAIGAVTNGRRGTPRDLAPVIEHGATHLHQFVSELRKLAVPDEPAEDLQALLAEARMRMPLA